MKAIFLALLLSTNLFGAAVITTSEAYKLNRASKLFRDLAVGTQLAGGGWVKGAWQYANQGGAANSDIVLKDEEGNPVILPQGALITDCLIDITAPVTAGAITSAVIGFSSNAVGDLKANTVAHTAGYNSTTKLDCIPVSTAATTIRMASEASLKMRIGSEALTGGKINLYVNYVLSE